MRMVFIERQNWILFEMLQQFVYFVFSLIAEFIIMVHHVHFTYGKRLQSCSVFVALVIDLWGKFRTSLTRTTS